MLLSKATEGFVLHLTAERYSSNTIAIYTWALKLLAYHLHDPDLVSIQPIHLTSFFAWLAAGYIPTRANKDTSPLTPRSVENVWTALRSFYNWAVPNLGLLHRPDLHIKRPRYALPDIQPFSEEETKALLKACEYTAPAQSRGFVMRRPTANRDTAIVLLLLDTGVRVSECARLTVADTNLTTGEVHIQGYGSGRKSRPRTVYLGKRSRAALWKYLAERDRPSGSLLITCDSHPMDRNSIRLILNALGKRASVPHTHPHRFRHTFAIQYLRNGGDVFTLQRLLGHTSLEMVRRYLALADADDQAAHQRASPADRWRL